MQANKREQDVKISKKTNNNFFINLLFFASDVKFYTNQKYIKALAKSLDFAQLSSLTFEKPDMQTFALLPLAFHTIKEDGVLPAVLNAADEIAVDAFLKGKIGFVDIFDVVSSVVYNFKNIKNPTLDDISNADKEARIRAKECINAL